MRFLRIAGVLVVIALVIAGYAIFRLTQPYQGFSGAIFVDFPRGTSTATVARQLADAGVVSSRWEFLLARLIERNRKPQAGEYKFDQPASPLEVFKRLARGDIFYYELVVPEGKNLFDIADTVAGLGLFPASQFLEAARNPAMIRDLDPHAPTLEGYLFPSTYRVSRHTTPEQLCRMMTGKFREVWRNLRNHEDPHQSKTFDQLSDGRIDNHEI